MNYSKEELQLRKEEAAKEAESMSRKNAAPEKPKNLPQGNFNLLSLLESDSILIFLLIMLLIREKADKEIIFALLYILI